MPLAFHNLNNRVYAQDGGRSYELKFDQCEQLLSVFHDAGLKTSFNDLHEAYTRAGGVPWRTARAA